MDIVSLDQLITRAKLFADQINSDANNFNEWSVFINDAIRQYWHLVEQLTQDYYFQYSYFQTEPQVLSYPLPADMLHLRGVDAAYFIANGNVTDPNNLWVALSPFMFAERNARNFLYYAVLTPPYFSRYRLQANEITFEPLTSPQPTTIRLSYTRKYPNLQNPDDTVDVISGFDMYIAKVAAIHAKNRAEDDISFLVADVNRFESEIKQIAGDRNRDTAPRVQDVYSKQFGFWGWY